ncbi:MAG: LPS export ABC transporter permease LptG [Rhodothalassiaceae bacterium]
MTGWLMRLRRAPAPSFTLTLYMTRRFLMRFAVLLGLLVSILLMLDVLANSDEILADPAADQATLLRYVALRLPQLLTLFAPFAALLGALVTLGQMNQGSEITVLRAAGLSAHRILFPLGLGCLLIAIGHFVFQETVVVEATARLDYWEDNGFALDLGPPPESRADVWIGDNRTIIHAASVTRSGTRVILDDVTVYDRGPDELLSGSMTADFAWYNDGGWTLYGARRFDAADLTTVVREVQPWDLDVPPDRFLTETIEPDHSALGDLDATIEQLNREGADTRDLRTAFLKRFAAPMGALIMPVMAAVVGFGSARAGKLFARAILGMAMGFGFFVVQNFMLALGELGTVPPVVAAFAPVAFFLLLGYAAVFIVEE